METDSADAILRRVDDEKLDYVRCQFIDFIGVARGRTVRREYLPHVLHKGLPFAQVNNTVDIDDLETDLTYGSQAGDFWAVPDPASFARLPYATATGHMFTDLVGADGAPWPTCTRSALRRVTELARKELGTVRLGFEQEGYLLRKDGERYTPLHRGKQFTAEILDAEDGFISDLGSALVIMGMPLEKITAEGGWGMFEVNVAADEPVGAAERYFRFKHTFRALARQHGYVGSFMPKPFQDGTGAGLHVHISLVDALDGRDLLHDRSDPRGVGLSMLGHYFLGGLLAHAEAITALGAPSVNSYKRLQPGTWAPTHVTYGVGNRSAMIRIVENREVPTRCAGALPSEQRLEVRSADGTCNPYLLAAILLASGLDGVRRCLDPGPPTNADVARMSEAELAESGLRPLPRSLDRALDGLAADDVAAAIMGPPIVNGFLKAKRIEWDKFAAHVSAWEHRYYAEFY